MIIDVNKIKKSVGIIGESDSIEEMCTLNWGNIGLL